MSRDIWSEAGKRLAVLPRTKTAYACTTIPGVRVPVEPAPKWEQFFVDLFKQRLVEGAIREKLRPEEMKLYHVHHAALEAQDHLSDWFSAAPQTSKKSFA